MSAYSETGNTTKDDEETTTGENNPPNAGAGTTQIPSPDQGEESRYTNT